jgi:hypothetical protein
LRIQQSHFPRNKGRKTNGGYFPRLLTTFIYNKRKLGRFSRSKMGIRQENMRKIMEETLPDSLSGRLSDPVFRKEM